MMEDARQNLRRRRIGGTRGFTLIELLMVIAILGILATLLFTAANAARRRARMAQATAETRELAKAWKSYWMVYGKWPSGFGGNEVDMDTSAMKILLCAEGISSNDNPQRIKFMDVKKIVSDSGFKDPWGRFYRVRFKSTGEQETDEYYETTVFFPSRSRYGYE